jgi:hypothetical protein
MIETTPIHSPYGGFSEGDHVTRDGTDVHLVKDMTPDGFAATFVCVVAPESGWCAVGDEEFNTCRRYMRLARNPESGAWEANLGHREWPYIDPVGLKGAIKAMVEHISNQMTQLADSMAAGYIGGAGFARAWSDKMRRSTSRTYFKRKFKRRALRK